MSKKLLCFILTLCMLLQAFGMVSFASEEMLTDEIILENVIELENVNSGQFRKYFVNDDFNTEGDLGGWAMGPSHPSTTTGSVSQTTLGDGTGVMLISRTDTNGSGDYSKELRADRDFEDITIEGKKLIIEARVKTSGNASGQAYLRYNSPSETSYKWVLATYDPSFRWTGHNGGVITEFNAAASSVKYKKDLFAVSDLLTGVGYDTKWVNIRAEIDGTDSDANSYKLYAWEDGNEANASSVTGAMKELDGILYDPDYHKETGTKKTAYDTLKNLAFSLRNQNNVCVDYVRGYYDRPFVTASASLESNTVSPSGSVTVNFSGSKIPAFPEGAVTIDGVECEINPDVAAQKITFTPKAKLTPGDVHTVRIDDELFLSKEGVVIGGQTEFNVEVQYAQATALLISNTTIEANESVTVKIDSTEKITSVPEGLVTIDGVVCSVALDVAAQTVTLTPVNPFSAGGNYTVTINTELLKTDCGSILNGENSFDFSIAPLSVFGLEIDGKPAPEVTVGVKYDYEGVNGEGSHIFKWQTAQTADAPENEWVTLQNGTDATYTFGYDIGHGEYVRVIMTPFDANGNEGRTITSEPVMFKYVPSEDEDGTVFRKYYINDDYNTAGDVGNWKVGETTAVAGQTITVTQENLTENGETIGAMKFFAYKNDPEYLTDKQPYADNDFTDIPFNTNSKIVIETRMKVLGGYLGNTETLGSWAGLKFNRPNQVKYLVENSNINYRGWNGGTLFLVNHETGLRYKSGSYQDGALAEGDYRDKWINVKVVIDGTDGNMQDYTITVTDDNGLNVTQTAGTLKEQQTAMYDVKSAVDSFNYNTKNQHTDIRNLSLVLRNFADTIYLDYFKVYELRPAQTATVSLPNGTSIRPADSIKVKFNGSQAIEEFAEGVVTIDGVECNVTSDIDAQTVTVTPKQKLTPAATYTLKVSPKVLANSVGFVLEGEKEFTINVTDVNIYNVITTGRVVPGTEMGVDYTYADSPVFEGEPLYQWQKSTDGVTWVDITGETNSTYIVTQDIYDNGNYVRVVVTPRDENGKQGLATSGGYVAPETAPVLSNLITNTTVLFNGAYVTPVYNYFDLNGDRIVKKTVNWYSSSSESGPWTLASTDENYLIKESDSGKYFKYDIKIENNGPRKNESTLYESGVVGPVADILSTTNLLINPGFERGDLRGWKPDEGIIELAGKEGARTGNYAVHLMPRAGVSDDWAQKVTGLTPNKSYILSGYAKNTSPDLPQVTNFWPYPWSGLARTGGNDYSYLIGNEWIQVTGSFRATAATASVDFVSFQSMNADCYIDDTYFGELIITDIETFTPDATEIPVEGSVKLPITSGKIFNQVGTTHGLTAEKVMIRVPEGTSGITQEGNNLVVDSSAVAGTYVVEVYCEPSYAESSQSVFQEFVTVELLANNDSAPKARNVKATGEVAERSKLKGSYDYYQINGIAGNSSVKWVYSDTIDGTYTDIPGATSTVYTVDAQYADKFIKFAVLPATVEGVPGSWTYSNALTGPKAPFATDVKISGEAKVGSALTVTYTHNDYNESDEKDEAVYQWYASDYATSGFAPISGANARDYVLTENEIDKYIKVSVTPVSKANPKTGVAVMSDALFGPSAPKVENVTITQNGLTLVGSYKYSHISGARETNSIYKWTVNGAVVSNKIDYTINFTGAAYVEFSVTPVGDTNPSTGKTYSYGAYFEGYPAGNGGTVSGGGFGGGGGGGGGAGSTGITNINDMKLPETEVKQPENTQPKSDLDGHWGETYVKEMEKRGVMKADDKGNFDPDRIVSRAEMITYLFDALGLEEAEYNAEFSDVSALDGYAGKLQAMIDNGTIASYHEFRPNDGISRQEMCKILYVSLENAGKLKKAETNNLDVFTDKDLIADWATDYVNTIYVNKIMIGTSDVTFAPTENITRAQVATMLVRILKVIEG